MGFVKHPTAIISTKAEIGDNVSIGAFTIIEDDVKIGNNTEIRSSVILANGTRLGNNCKVFAGSIIGTEPQDLKFVNEPTIAQIGDNTVIREFVTINRGTVATGITRIGENCLVMSYCHVAHDCHIGNNVIMSNVSHLAGHVTIEDWANLGGFTKVHQFCTIGTHSMIGGDLKLVKDVAPYTLIGKVPPKVEGINKIGLKRKNFPQELINEIEEFYNMILYSGYNITDGIAEFMKRPYISPEVKHCIGFIKKSERGIHR
jgi:UDP-N-acetylglucosamine acyltransferase